MGGETLEQLLVNLLEGSLSTVVAFVFFISYFQDKKDDKEYKRTALEHEREMAIILNRANDAFAENREIIKDTREMHEDMDAKLDAIQEQLNHLTENTNQYEMIVTINSIRDMLMDLKKELGA